MKGIVNIVVKILRFVLNPKEKDLYLCDESFFLNDDCINTKKLYPEHKNSQPRRGHGPKKQPQPPKEKKKKKQKQLNINRYEEFRSNPEG